MVAPSHIFPRVPRRYSPILFAFVMSTMICAVTSFMITAINTGIDPGYGARWLRAYVLAWSFAFPTVAIVAPHVRRWIDRLCA